MVPFLRRKLPQNGTAGTAGSSMKGSLPRRNARSADIPRRTSNGQQRTTDLFHLFFRELFCAELKHALFVIRAVRLVGAPDQYREGKPGGGDVPDEIGAGCHPRRSMLVGATCIPVLDPKRGPEEYAAGPECLPRV